MDVRVQVAFEFVEDGVARAPRRARLGGRLVVTRQRADVPHVVAGVLVFEFHHAHRILDGAERGERRALAFPPGGEQCRDEREEDVLFLREVVREIVGQLVEGLGQQDELGVRLAFLRRELVRERLDHRHLAADVRVVMVQDAIDHLLQWPLRCIVTRFASRRDVVEFADEHGWIDALGTAPFWLALSGVVVAWYMYLVNPAVPAAFARVLRPLVVLLENKYFMDWINEHILARLARALGTGLWKGGDQALIDGAVVNGSWRLVGAVSAIARHLQSGYLYHYAFTMIVAVALYLGYLLMRS